MADLDEIAKQVEKAHQDLARAASRHTLAQVPDLREQLDTIRQTLSPQFEELRQAAHSMMAGAASQAAFASLAEHARQLGAEQQHRIATVLAALDTSTLQQVTDQLGANTTGDLLRQLSSPGMAAMADIARQAGEAQRAALAPALSSLREVNTPALNQIAEQLARLERERPGAIGVSDLQAIGAQLASIREQIHDSRGARAMAAAARDLNRAMVAPVAEARRVIEEQGRLVNLDALEAAIAYWSASYAALPKELRAKIRAPAVHLTPEQSREEFDRRARQLMHMPGEEFLRRWDAGEFRDELDDPEYPELLELVLLLPLAR